MKYISCASDVFINFCKDINNVHQKTVLLQGSFHGKRWNF